MCNDMTEDLKISNYSDLESLVIGDNALKNVPQVIFRNLPVLKTLTIGDNVFNKTIHVVVDSNLCDIWVNSWIDVPFTNGVYSAGSEVFSTFDDSSYYYSSEGKEYGMN